MSINFIRQLSHTGQILSVNVISDVYALSLNNFVVAKWNLWHLSSFEDLISFSAISFRGDINISSEWVFSANHTRAFFPSFSVAHLRPVVGWYMEISFVSNKKFYASVSILNEMGCCEILEFSPNRNNHTKYYLNNRWSLVSFTKQLKTCSQNIIFRYASYIYFLRNNAQIFFF